MLIYYLQYVSMREVHSVHGEYVKYNILGKVYVYFNISIFSFNKSTAIYTIASQSLERKHSSKFTAPNKSLH